MPEPSGIHPPLQNAQSSLFGTSNCFLNTHKFIIITMRISKHDKPIGYPPIKTPNLRFSAPTITASACVLPERYPYPCLDAQAAASDNLVLLAVAPDRGGEVADRQLDRKVDSRKEEGKEEVPPKHRADKPRRTAAL